MARARKKSSSSGGTYTGILIGLILGLGAAVAVALFVTKVPMPFVDKASRDKPTVALPEGRDLLDPNRGLYGNSNGQTPPPGDTIPGLTLPPANLPSISSKPAAPDALGDLIATLPAMGTEPTRQPEARTTAPAVTPPATAPAAPSTPTPASSKPATPAPAAPPAAKPATTSTPYYLQAGAFRNHADADAMKARLLMLGFNASVQSAQVNGSTVNRVRMGPFKGIDDMNRARSRLAEEKIDTSVVRP
ncbi:SPOR domain-containing protein [Alcaligenes faecalis]|uniref:SPOR domain-containing protein n=1 Tax=Alcaligenes faecalis TaxID=511 RepID=UPI002932A52E|nr:SPOR domain-containing protein [Alcaligenes faecalis]MDV2116297.1 SPOR domain-containing protein [Alcaligenes faecalis]